MYVCMYVCIYVCMYVYFLLCACHSVNETMPLKILQLCSCLKPPSSCSWILSCCRPLILAVLSGWRVCHNVWICYISRFAQMSPVYINFICPLFFTSLTQLCPRYSSQCHPLSSELIIWRYLCCGCGCLVDHNTHKIRILSVWVMTVVPMLITQ